MRIFANNKTATGVVIATIATTLIKYSETKGNLTYADWAQISGIVGAGLLSIYPEQSNVIKAFHEIDQNVHKLQSMRGIYGMTNDMLDLLKRLNEEDRPCAILCNHTNTYLWINSLQADQNSQGNPDWSFDMAHYRDSAAWFDKSDDLSVIHQRIKYEGSFVHKYNAINQGTGRLATYENYFENFEINCDPTDDTKKQNVRFVTSLRFELI